MTKIKMKGNDDLGGIMNLKLGIVDNSLKNRGTEQTIDMFVEFEFP